MVGVVWGRPRRCEWGASQRAPRSPAPPRACRARARLTRRARARGGRHGVRRTRRGGTRGVPGRAEDEACGGEDEEGDEDVQELRRKRRELPTCTGCKPRAACGGTVRQATRQRPAEKDSPAACSAAQVRGTLHPPSCLGRDGRAPRSQRGIAPACARGFSRRRRPWVGRGRGRGRWWGGTAPRPSGARRGGRRGGRRGS